MKLTSVFVVCPAQTPSNPVTERLGMLLGLTLEDPQTHHLPAGQKKVLYWKDLEFGDHYNVGAVINKMSAEFPSYVMYGITRPTRTFREKNGWWLGIISSAVIATTSILLGFYS